MSTKNVTVGDLTATAHKLIARSGSLKRWGKFEEEAEARAEARRLLLVRDRLRADEALTAAGIRYEDYVQ